MSNQRYMQRGVSASKEDVHNAIKNIDKGIFPKAFCKIIPDILGGDPEYCNIMHADGAGTKSSLSLSSSRASKEAWLKKQKQSFIICLRAVSAEIP